MHSVYVCDYNACVIDTIVPNFLFGEGLYQMPFEFVHPHCITQ